MEKAAQVGETRKVISDSPCLDVGAIVDEHIRRSQRKVFEELAALLTPDDPVAPASDSAKRKAISDLKLGDRELLERVETLLKETSNRRRLIQEDIEVVRDSITKQTERLREKMEKKDKILEENDILELQTSVKNLRELEEKVGSGPFNNLREKRPVLSDYPYFTLLPIMDEQLKRKEREMFDSVEALFGSDKDFVKRIRLIREDTESVRDAITKQTARFLEKIEMENEQPEK